MRDSNPGSCAPEVDALTNRPTRWFLWETDRQADKETEGEHAMAAENLTPTVLMEEGEREKETEGEHAMAAETLMSTVAIRSFDLYFLH